MLDRSHVFFLSFFFCSRTFSCPSLSSIPPLLISSPITFFPSAWRIHARDQMRANRSTRARCAQVCAVWNILGVLKESRFSTDRPAERNLFPSRTVANSMMLENQQDWTEEKMYNCPKNLHVKCIRDWNRYRLIQFLRTSYAKLSINTVSSRHFFLIFISNTDVRYRYGKGKPRAFHNGNTAIDPSTQKHEWYEVRFDSI